MRMDMKKDGYMKSLKLILIRSQTYLIIQDIGSKLVFWFDHFMLCIMRKYCIVLHKMCIACSSKVFK